MPSSLSLSSSRPTSCVVLEHPVGIDAETGLALPLGREMGPDVHPGGVPPQEEGLVLLLGLVHEAQRFLRELVVHRFHALDVQRAGELDLLRAVRVRPGVEHAARRVFLLHFRVLEVVGVLRLLLGVQVVERAVKLVESVRGRQMLVAVPEVVLAELTGLVALRLQQLGDRHVPRLKPFLGARQPDLEKAGAEGRLARDECRAPGGATLLAVPVGEQRAFLCDAVDVGRLVAHHALVVGADVPVADVVAPDHQDVGLLRRRLRKRRRGQGEERGQKQTEASRELPVFVHVFPISLKKCRSSLASALRARLRKNRSASFLSPIRRPSSQNAKNGMNATKRTSALPRIS